MLSEKVIVKREKFLAVQASKGRAAAALLFVLVLFTSCKQEDDKIVYQQQHHWVEKTVAVVAPLGNAATKTRLEQTAGWFLDNFHEAQLRDTLCIRLKLEWHDELSEDMAALGTTLASRDDVLAVIGPFDNNHVAAFAPACKQTLKPLIAPTATSEDVIRRYAVTTKSGLRKEKPFLWSLTESDVAFSEMLMSHFATFVKYLALEDVTPEAALFTPNDAYGKTFFDWLPFQAENFDITVPCNQQYSGSADLQQRLRDYLTSLHSRSDVDMSHVNTFCVVESAQQLYDVALMRRQWMLSDPTLKSLFRADGFSPSEADPFDPAYNERWQLFESTFRTWFALSNISEEDIDALGEQGAGLLQGYQGFSPYADPSTGFELSYTKKFRQQPTFAECKLYDALLLVGFAASYAEHNQKGDADKTLNDAIIAVSSVNQGDGIPGGAAWSLSAMEQYLKALEQGRLFHLIGASGEIAFDSESYTAATATTYLHWQVLDGQLVHQAYYGAGGTHVASASAAWKYLYDEQQALADWDEMTAVSEASAPAIQYPDLTAQYAVLVQGSNGLKNYRHQADVLSMYQLLRKNGFTDDQIILVVDRALAQDKDNPEKGIIRTSMTGPDLLGGTSVGSGFPAAVIDYDAATLTAADIADILLGRQSSRLPVVLPREVGQNVFFYWSGHGRSIEHGGSNEFEWRDAPVGQGFTADLLRQTANEMLTQGYCSKMLIVAEPCYGEVVVRPLEGIQGVLAITGASATEQSWSDNWRDPGLFWMCDRFSQNFVNGFTANPNTNYRDLYLYCSQHTLGSHVKIVNAAHFGNLYTTGPQEFLVKYKE